MDSALPSRPHSEDTPPTDLSGQLQPEEPLQRVEQLFRRGEALDRIDGDVEFLCELIEQFQQDSPGLMLQVRDGIRSGDGPTIRQAAHTLKGAVCLLSAPEVEAAALSVELAATTHDDALESHYATLDELLIALNRELSEFRSSTGSS